MTPPGSAMPSSRAATLTASPSRSAPSTTTSPRWIPIRNAMRRSAAVCASRAARSRCTARPQRTASTTLGNSTRMPSPVVLMTRPRLVAMAGSMRSSRSERRRASVPSSSIPTRRLYPATSAASTAESLRSTRSVPIASPSSTAGRSYPFTARLTNGLLLEQRIHPDARPAAIVEEAQQVRQSPHRRGLEVVVFRRVVEHHDRAVGHAPRDPPDDRVRRPRPDAVEAARRPADDRQPRAAHAERRRDARVPERRTEEAGPDARRVLDRPRRPHELLAYAPRHAERVPPVVTIAVHPDRVPGGVDLADHVRMTTCLRAEDE